MQSISLSEETQIFKPFLPKNHEQVFYYQYFANTNTDMSEEVPSTFLTRMFIITHPKVSFLDISSNIIQLNYNLILKVEMPHPLFISCLKSDFISHFCAEIEHHSAQLTMQSVPKLGVIPLAQIQRVTDNEKR